LSTLKDFNKGVSFETLFYFSSGVDFLIGRLTDVTDYQYVTIEFNRLQISTCFCFFISTIRQSIPKVIWSERQNYLHLVGSF
jgi:hypothetical protein